MFKDAIWGMIPAGAVVGMSVLWVEMRLAADRSGEALPLCTDWRVTPASRSKSPRCQSPFHEPLIYRPIHVTALFIAIHGGRVLHLIWSFSFRVPFVKILIVVSCDWSILSSRVWRYTCASQSCSSGQRLVSHGVPLCFGRNKNVCGLLCPEG